jgi:hypothetical protein
LEHDGLRDAGSADAPADAEASGEDALDPSICCICLSARKNTLLLPCRHLCVCDACGTALVERSTALCPLCRTFVEARVMEVFT